MRFCTDDQRFGIVLSPVPGALSFRTRMFAFQLALGDQIVGDAEPCFPYGALNELAGLRHLDDERLRGAGDDPDAVSSLLLSDEPVPGSGEFLHDVTCLNLAESLDGWGIHAYVRRGTVTFLAQARDNDGSVGPVLVCEIPEPDYRAVVQEARAYWEEAHHS